MRRGNKFSQVLVYLILFVIGGLVYTGIEILWRGHTHYSMFFVGGICFLAVGSINEIITRPMSLLLQGCIGSLIITSIEYISGIILNIYLGLDVWDYSNLPLNLLGQICVPFMIVWIFLAMICVVVNDALLVFFGLRKEMPKYKLFGGNG